MNALKADTAPPFDSSTAYTLGRGRAAHALRALQEAAGADTRWRPVPTMDLAHVRSSWPRARSPSISQHGGRRWRHDPSCCWVKVIGATGSTHARGEVACFRKRSSFLTGAMVASSMAPGRWHQLASSARQCVSPCPYLVLFRECVESAADECGELSR